MNEKLTEDFRFRCGRVIFPISIVTILILLAETDILCDIQTWQQVLWCFSFVLLGFSILVLKISINSLQSNELAQLQEPNTEKERHEGRIQKAKANLELKKAKLRYKYYYPAMLIVISALSFTVSISKFGDSKELFLVSSALLSFFMGFFVDSLVNIVEKLGGIIGGKG